MVFRNNGELGVDAETSSYTIKKFYDWEMQQWIAVSLKLYQVNIFVGCAYGGCGFERSERNTKTTYAWQQQCFIALAPIFDQSEIGVGSDVEFFHARLSCGGLNNFRR